MRFLRHAFTGLFLLAVTAALLVWAASMVREAASARMNDGGSRRPAQERVFAVNVVSAVAGPETPVLRAFGQVQSRRTLEIRASASGSLIEVAPNFVEGGLVAKGDVLARIDPAQAQAALDRADADLRDAEFEVRDADRALLLAQDDLTSTEGQLQLYERALQRQRDLQARGIGSDSTVEAAELSAAQARASMLSSRQALANAEARVDQAATALDRASIARKEAQRDLDDTVIRAGF
ncbi:MAG: biotin/lipoyl-binding protein, partial [Pseudomonadota bacterium]|nr:biotin/lipoyl-binding protein [Pseudomonadota bacterium]